MNPETQGPVTWDDSDLKPGFKLNCRNITHLYYLENGMTICGVPLQKKGATKNFKYPMQLQQVNFGEGPKLIFAPIPGCGDIFEVFQQAVCGRSPVRIELLAAYNRSATIEFGLTEEGLDNLQAKHDARRQTQIEESQRLEEELRKKEEGSDCGHAECSDEHNHQPSNASVPTTDLEIVPLPGTR